jgi:hypothetical protein
MSGLTGRCQCGGVAYAVAGAPIGVYVCHCLECRRQSASAFGISVIVRAADVAVLRGSLKTWTRPTDSGGTLVCSFCATCGSRLFHAAPGGATLSVKGGSLDVPPDLRGAVHIWTSRKMPGVPIPPDAAQFLKEPDS